MVKACSHMTSSDYLYYCYTDQVPYGEFSNWWLSDMTDEQGTTYRSTGPTPACVLSGQTQSWQT